METSAVAEPHENVGVINTLEAFLAIENSFETGVFWQPKIFSSKTLKFLSAQSLDYSMFAWLNGD